MNSHHFVQWAYRSVLRRECCAEDCEHVVAQLDSGATTRLQLLERLLSCDEYEYRFRFRERTAFPDGHFYSPLPSDHDVTSYERSAQPLFEPAGIDLRLSEQMQLAVHLQPMYSDIPFGERPSERFRFGFDNESYVYGDAIFSHLLIRWLAPQRIIEVGSGNSSCVTLDTNEHFFQNRIRCSFIEPFPEFLRSLLRVNDSIDLLQLPLQDVPLSVFDSLAARDILFIDSTHVSKLQSDVNRLFFEILPRLQAGVFIHIHDVFPGFEYPLQWLQEGRAWNEQYLLRAFLQYNEQFHVRMFHGLLAERERPWFEKNMPLVLKNPGGSIWLEKVK